MKTLTFVWIFLLSVVTSAQQNIPLDSCYAWTRENYPNLIQTEIWEQISQLKRDNLKTAYLPQIT